jgi:hypothetical protein
MGPYLLIVRTIGSSDRLEDNIIFYGRLARR